MTLIATIIVMILCITALSHSKQDETALRQKKSRQKTIVK